MQPPLGQSTLRTCIPKGYDTPVLTLASADEPRPRHDGERLLTQPPEQFHHENAPKRHGPAGLIKNLSLGSSLGFTHALLQALSATMTATGKFFLTFDLFVSHVSLRGEPH